MENNIREWVEQACNRGGRPEFLPELQFEFSERMTTTMGMAYTHSKLIKFSAPLFRITSIEEQRKTVFHEIGHVIANWYGGTHHQAGHGWGWRAVMAKMGFPNAERCHNNMELYKPRSTTLFYTCPICQIKYKFAKKIQMKMGGGMRAWCKRCKTPITLENLRATQS